MTTPTSPATSRPKSRCSTVACGRRGLTLLELMVVLVVMSVLAGAIVPSLVSAADRDGIGTAAARLKQALDFACAAATGRRQSVAVSLDPETARCRVSAYRPGLPWRQAEEREGPQGLMEAQLPGRVTLFVEKATEDGEAAGEEWNTIWFRADGTSEDALIEVTDPDGEVLLVEVVGATGRVSIERE